MSPLQPFGERIWICDGPRVRMMTIPFSTRMTVVQLESGALWIHSPVDPAPDVIAAVEALGTVTHIVAPNKIHSIGVQPWKKRYPSAEVWASPRFHERHPAAPIDHLFGATASPWDGQIEAVCFAGSTFLDEVVFYHAPSRTLIVTDLIQRHDPSQESTFWRFVKRKVGVLGASGGTAKDLLLTFKDHAAARRSVEAVLRWDFDRVVIAHGTCITEDAHRVVEEVFGWVLS